MIEIFILGVSLLGALACALSIKYFLHRCDTKSITYTPMENSNNSENSENLNDIPPKYNEFNLVN